MLKFYMYRLLSEIFPAKAIHTPPFRTCGIAGTVSLPYTVYKPWLKLNSKRWDSTENIILLLSDSVKAIYRKKEKVLTFSFNQIGLI